MKNKILSSTIVFTLVLTVVILILNINEVNAHKSKKHKPMVCIPEEDRTEGVINRCKLLLQFHRLCKESQDCAIIRLEEAQKKVDELNKKIKQGRPVSCKGLNFGHVALEDAKVFQEMSGNSKVIKKIKKGQQISWVGEASKKGWLIVVPKDKICNIGYINERYVGQANMVEDLKPKLKTKYAINLTYPKWNKKRELILLNQSGWFEIDGYISQDLGINKVTLNYEGNDEEVILGNDGSFNASLLISDEDLDVRITGYKNNKQVGKTLKFKIKVGN